MNVTKESHICLLLLIKMSTQVFQIKTELLLEQSTEKQVII
jgi:hypothetical protein